jgi:hypothetical protein
MWFSKLRSRSSPCLLKKSAWASGFLDNPPQFPLLYQKLLRQESEPNETNFGRTLVLYKVVVIVSVAAWPVQNSASCIDSVGGVWQDRSCLHHADHKILTASGRGLICALYRIYLISFCAKTIPNGNVSLATFPCFRRRIEGNTWHFLLSISAVRKSVMAWQKTARSSSVSRLATGLLPRKLDRVVPCHQRIYLSLPVKSATHSCG